MKLVAENSVDSLPILAETSIPSIGSKIVVPFYLLRSLQPCCDQVVVSAVDCAPRSTLFVTKGLLINRPRNNNASFSTISCPYTIVFDVK